MANFHIDGNTVKISGDISISYAESLVNLLKEAGNISGEKLIDLSNLETWDSSSVQILISFLKSNKKENIKWINVPENFVRDLKIMGILTLFKRGE
ncbi:MAG: STAS domain-containing protein [bacterium]